MSVDAGDEMVDIVDERDVVLETVTRREMRASRRRHRAVFIAVMDGQGRLLVHRRSALKDIWPSWCDLAVGGVVGSGEDYLAAAHRELSEEVGIETTELIHLDDGVARPYQDDQVSLMARCFAVITNGPFSFDDGEVTQAWWVHRDGLNDLLTREKFLPDSVALVLPLLDI